MAGAVAALAAFNLLCQGMLTTTTFDGQQVEPYSRTYRVDLDAGQWCESDCKILRPIVEVQPAFITLQDSKATDPALRSTVLNMVNRETGAHTILSTLVMGRRTTTTVVSRFEGQCERQDFTGFPELETKF